MKKEEFIALGIDEKQAEKAAEASENELKGYIPKARFDEMSDAKTQLEKDVAARDKQIDELKQVDPAQLQDQIAKLQQENADAKKQYETALKAQKVDTAVTLALTNARAVNVRAVKALLTIDPEKAELSEDGTVKGLAEQIKALQGAEDSKMLFKPESRPVLRGFQPGEGCGPADGASQEEPKTLGDAIGMVLGAQTQAE